MELIDFLDQFKDSVWRIDSPISVYHEISALQHQLEKRNKRPVIFIEKPKLLNGKISQIPLVCNLTASRALTARVLNINDHQDFARQYQKRIQQIIKPMTVNRKEAPCQEVVYKDDVDLEALPALVQHDLAPGPYLTAAHVTTYDPDTGIDNCAIQRCWIKGARHTTLFTYPTTHNSRNIKKFWARQKACPVAMWIGHHPTVVMGTQAKLKYPESHWEAASSFIGEPLRLVPSITHGDNIMVPADAEIVIEGWIPVEKLEEDGPFGEYTGYVGPKTMAQRIDVTCMTSRHQPVYHDYGSGLPDMLVPDNMLNEAKLFGMIKAVCPSVIKVHVPESGHRFHAYIQLKNPDPGESRDALMAALAYRRLKMAIVFDEDLDIYDDKKIMWGLATRVQWQRDVFTVDGLSGSGLDPSFDHEIGTVEKIGIDATFSGQKKPGIPRSEFAGITVNAEALSVAERLISGHDGAGWPKI